MGWNHQPGNDESNMFFLSFSGVCMVQLAEAIWRSDPVNLAVVIPNYVNSQSNCLLEGSFMKAQNWRRVEEFKLGAEAFYCYYTSFSTKGVSYKIILVVFWVFLGNSCEIFRQRCRGRRYPQKKGQIRKAYRIIGLRRNPTKLDSFFGRATTQRRGHVLLKFCGNWMGWRMLVCFDFEVFRQKKDTL